MNCPHATELVFAERDRSLTPDEWSALEEHVARCRACGQLRTGLTQAATAWRETTAALPVPDAAGEWQLVRRQLHSAPTVRSTSPRLRWPAWAAWTGLPLAAAAALALIFWSPDHAPTTPTLAEGAAPAYAEFVEPSDNAASTVVYVDQESGWLIVWASSPARGIRS